MLRSRRSARIFATQPLQRTAIIIGWGWVALVAFRLLLKVKFTAQVMESAEMEISVDLHK